MVAAEFKMRWSRKTVLIEIRCRCQFCLDTDVDEKGEKNDGGRIAVTRNMFDLWTPPAVPAGGRTFTIFLRTPYPPARTTRTTYISSCENNSMEILCCKIRRKKSTNIGWNKIGCGILAQLLASPFGSFGVVLASIVNWGGKLAPRSMEQLDSCDMWPLVALWTLWMWTLWSVACGMWTLVACGKFCWNFFIIWLNITQ